MKNILILSSLTIKELMRSKAVISTVVSVFILLLVATLFGSVSVSDKGKVILDFGLFLISLSSIIFVLLSGTSLLSKELSRKTIYNVLSKPVQRWQFVVGKFLGMYSVAAILVVLLTPMVLLYESIFTGSFEMSLLWTSFYMLLELLIVCALAMFFSAILVTPALAGALTLGLFLVGRNADSLLDFKVALGDSGLLSKALSALYWAVPHLNAIYINNDAVYGHFPPLDHIIYSGVYAICYSGILLVLGSLIFSKKEFN